ncbi:MAG: PQQ-dependent dehydrogenase, methanol/ethanol family [Rhodobiaceae bacterium]|nr:PQQ-dependent dehydrogenase, methanol/ethanol family [Rhodobiaceae bacterium]
MSDFLREKWPVLVNSAAGVVIAAVVVMQFAGGGDDADTTSLPDAVSGGEVAEAPAEETPAAPAEAVARAVVDVDGARIVNADSEPGNWMSHGRTYSEQRYSPLSQINDQNASELGLAWSFNTGTVRGLEATPIVVDEMLFTTGNWGVVHALNAKTGEELWEFDPEVPGEWARYGCCDIVNRGVAVWKGRVYVASFDGRLFALNAEDGSVHWEVNTIPGPPYTITGAPRIVNGKVIIGNGGAELGVRGYITAYDAETGEQAWRFYTVPGNPADGFEHPELEVAVETWKGGRWWEIGGGGTAWDSMAYDAELDTLYVGVGNGSPWTREIRSPGGGDNLYLSTILALDPNTGRLKWHYQTTPSDNWDYTATQHIVLAELEIDGKERKVLMQAPKNGFFYVIDRETGELLSADPYITVTWASHVDMETGRPVENPAVGYNIDPQFVFPSANGGHNWHPMAFNPDTGLVYIPTQEIGGIYTLANQWKEGKEFKVRENWWNTGLDWADYVDVINGLLAEGGELPIDHGYLKAFDPLTGETRWAIEMPSILNGGVLTTAGNLVLQGTADGRFVAYRADTGTELWRANVQTGIVAAPMTYEIDGEQYVAVMAGWGGTALPSGDARTSAAAKYGNDGRLLVFKVNGTEELPELALLDQTIPEQPEVTATPEQLRNGEVQFMSVCGLCHGALAVSGGVLPDLRRMSPTTREHFDAIVREGMLEENGMPNFGDLLNEQDVQDIYSYIIKRATEDRALQLPTE